METIAKNQKNEKINLHSEIPMRPIPYLPHTNEDRKEMFDFLGVKSIEDLLTHIPKELRNFELNLPKGKSEIEILEEYKKLERRARVLVELAAQAEAEELLDATPVTHSPRLILRIFADRDFDDVKVLAHRLVAYNGVLVLLATRTHETVRLVFARSADLPVEVNTLLHSVCEKLGGRGGGKPDFAQGGGTRVAELERVLAEVETSVTE
jgi:alanyl-tRNA synthetase